MDFLRYKKGRRFCGRPFFVPSNTSSQFARKSTMLFFLWKKGTRLRVEAASLPAFDGIFCVRLFRWKKVSLLTELENVPGWLSTKVPSLRDFLFARNPRRQKPGNRKPAAGA
ncbi:MAG: hypothetical protein D6714_04370 [Bacteroidetes bacterium]|nr:MAG: hypothetical protein D6714_04370 [Bacteroidota bacterium]